MNIQLLHQKNEDIEDMLRRMQNKEEISIDDVIVPAAPVYKQSVFISIYFMHLILQTHIGV